MHIVFLLGNYYPSYCAVGKCLGNLADELAKEHQITVICQLSKTDQKTAEQYQTQKIIRIATPYQLRRLKLEEKMKKNGGKACHFLKIRYFGLRTENTLRMLLSPQSLDKALINAYVRGLESIDDPIDLIVPTCTPFDTVVAAMKYKESHPEAVLRPVLFDKFADSETLHRNKINKLLKWENNQNLERKMFQLSDKVLYIPTWRNYINKYFSTYAYKSFEVEHPLITLKKKTHNNINRDTTCIVYTGVVDIKNRNPKQSLNTFIGIQNNHINLHFYSLGSAKTVIENYARMYPNFIFDYGTVSSEEAQKVMQQSDILLSLGNRDISQVPSKIFEYISWGKPIIHFAYSKNDPTVLYLEKYGNACWLYNDDDIKMNQKKILHFIKSNQNTIISDIDIQKEFKEFTPAYVSQKLISNLSKTKELKP